MRNFRWHSHKGQIQTLQIFHSYIRRKALHILWDILGHCDADLEQMAMLRTEPRWRRPRNGDWKLFHEMQAKISFEHSPWCMSASSLLHVSVSHAVTDVRLAHIEPWIWCGTDAEQCCHAKSIKATILEAMTMTSIYHYNIIGSIKSSASRYIIRFRDEPLTAFRSNVYKQAIRNHTSLMQDAHWNLCAFQHRPFSSVGPSILEEVAGEEYWLTMKFLGSGFNPTSAACPAVSSINTTYNIRNWLSSRLKWSN